MAARTRIRKVAICGFGLIGGSIALDLQKQGGRQLEIVAHDRRAVLGKVAEDRRFRVQTERNLDRAVRGAQVVLLSASLLANEKILTRLSGMPWLTDCLILDTGAVKWPIARLGGSLSFAEGTQFLPTHPMAGREKAGSENALARLFVERPWFVDESVDLSDANLARWKWLVSKTEATEVLVGSELHDELMAELSHLPQLISTMLGAQINGDMIELSGPGLRSMLRLSGSPDVVWSEIIAQNRVNILNVLNLYIENLQTMAGMIREEQSLKDIFAAAARSYRCLS